MRPRSLDEFVGQKHLLGPGKALSVLYQQGRVVSMILWGPPGSGKTTLARLLAERTEHAFEQLSAVSSGVRDVRRVLSQASEFRDEGKGTILFIDEIHRFNKAQQDALLHSVESGDIILIGATTENPSFEVIPPLRSRCRTFVLEPLSASDLLEVLNRALENDEVLKELAITFDDPELLIAYSGGDARALLNGLEMCVMLAGNEKDIHISAELIAEAFQRSFAQYDKSGEEHYNVISAFIKSVRGSDPDAALYWMARMLEGGEDPLFIARRMIILASEDVGNAEPNALLLATATFHAVHAIGMPEARIVLAQCATYLSYAPKSNAAYRAINDAIRDVKKLPPYPVPLHLRNPVTGLMKSMGYGKGYKYAHDFSGHFTPQDYLPEEMKDMQYYKPAEQGREASIRERLKKLWPRRKY